MVGRDFSGGYIGEGREEQVGKIDTSVGRHALEYGELVQQLKEGKRMFRAWPAVGRFMVRVGMDKRYAAHNMDVGESDEASQVRREKRGKEVTQVFSVFVHHAGCKDMIFKLYFGTTDKNT